MIEKQSGMVTEWSIPAVTADGCPLVDLEIQNSTTHGEGTRFDYKLNRSLIGEMPSM